MSLTVALTPNESQILAALRTFLLGFLPSGDAIFTGSIEGTTLTVAAITDGTINELDNVLGVGVSASTTIVQQLGGTRGGTGTYQVSNPQTTPSTTMTTGVEVIQAQQNRVPEPKGSDFIVMTTTFRARLSTNIDGYADCFFTGSIAGTVLEVSDVAYGTLIAGAPIYGSGVVPGTFITSLAGGSGGVGAYNVSASQDGGGQEMAAGINAITQPTRIDVQLDVHGQNSPDFAQTISTLMRDEFATGQFADILPSVSPLHADDPKRMPFVNDQQEYEWRWVVEVKLQANQTVTVGQQFFDQAQVILVNVDATYPPS
jgi:hypothetical protein